jgi:GNAT superfamily N-acetyltransferase
MDDPIFSIELAPRESSEAQALAQALGGEVAAEFGPRDEQTFALLARDSKGLVVGGVNGVIHWRWLYVAQFYVAPGARGAGLGCALLAEAERLARAKHCVGIYLDTFSEAASAFYQRRGFVIAGKIDNFPPGAARAFLSKGFSLAGRGVGPSPSSIQNVRQ